MPFTGGGPTLKQPKQSHNKKAEAKRPYTEGSNPTLKQPKQVPQLNSRGQSDTKTAEVRHLNSRSNRPPIQKEDTLRIVLVIIGKENPSNPSMKRRPLGN